MVMKNKMLGLLPLLCMFSFLSIQPAEHNTVSFGVFQERFLKGINTQDEFMVLGVLMSDNRDAHAFVEKNSLARKLYGILMCTTTQEDFRNEAMHVPFAKIKYMAEQMAKTGGNSAFLKNMGL